MRKVKFYTLNRKKYFIRWVKLNTEVAINIKHGWASNAYHIKKALHPSTWLYVVNYSEPFVPRL